MLLAFLLGLTGSLGHCVGMCGGVALLVSRRGVASGWRLLLAHLGRITTYGLLGLTAGALGDTVRVALPGLHQLQGVLALGVAGTAVYLALALLGRVPSPEILLAGLTRRWGRTFQHLTAATTADGARPTTVAPVFAIGLLWGFLPCGLVLTALLTAGVAGSPWHGTLTMLAFGLGTWPALLGVGWLMPVWGRWATRPAWPRQAAAMVVLLFGTQMALRGVATWGWVGHLRLGGVMLW